MNNYYNKYLKIFLIYIFLSLYSMALLASSVSKLSVSDKSMGIRIIGDQELPQVLYIVPWKERSLPSIAGINAEVTRDIFYNPCMFLQLSSNAKKQLSKDWQCLMQ